MAHLANVLGIEPAAAPDEDADAEGTVEDEGIRPAAAGYATASIEDADPTFQNRAPTARDDFYEIALGTTLILLPDEGPLANDSDPEGNRLALRMASSEGAEGTGLYLGSDGLLVFRTDALPSRPLRLHYRAFDGSQYSEFATITIAVSPL